MSKIFLHAPGMVSALGTGRTAHYQGLWREDSPLRREGDWLAGREIVVGRYGDTGEPLPACDPCHHSRNNWLLWQALAQIAPLVATAKARFGAERVAVVLGTSTTGGDENRAAFVAHVAGEPWENIIFSQQKQLLSAPADFCRAVFALTGISYGISTACTSGARALISAARLLRAGVADAVICGGVDTLSFLTINGFAALEVLSAGHCRPFGRGRDGINIGEAAAVFVATRAPLNDDVVELCAFGSASDAYHMSAPAPDGRGARLALQQALRAVDPAAVGWLNLHGTGTVQNDAMEARVVADLLPTALCSATKTLTGHTLGAAGALEAALCWLVLRGGVDLPPAGTLADDDTLPALRWAGKNAQWPTGRRLALSNSFAFGGNNACLLFGEVL